MERILPEIVLAVIGIVASVIGFLVIRVLKGIDTNQTNLSASLVKLWEIYDTLSKDFYKMSGEHNVNHHERRLHPRQT